MVKIVKSNFLRDSVIKSVLNEYEIKSQEMSKDELTYGTEVIAAYGVGNQIIGVIIFIALGFSMASTTLAGQFYGAKKFDHIITTKKHSLIMSVGTILVL